MPHEAPRSNPTRELRRRAEEKFQASEAAIQASPDPEDAKRMFHELRVYQIELDIQNEELRRAQAELEASRARYFDLYDLAPIGYCTLDENGLILEANLTAAALLNVARSVLIKHPITNFILPEDQDIYYRHRIRLFETGEAQVCELRMRRPDADPFWARMEASIGQDVEDTAVCRAVISDITDRKRAEAEKTKVDTQYQQIRKAESLGRMAGAVAHHFNNLLTVVMGNLEMVLDHQHDPLDTTQKLTDAYLAAQKAADLSGLMLTYLGQSSCEQSRLDLSETCHRLLPWLQTATPKGVTLECDLPAAGPIIRVNANQIQQILTHLITNAWEACGDSQGAIRLAVKTVSSSAAVEAPYHYPIDWRPEDDAYACLEVADTGCGIAQKDFENLFDPFFTRKFIGRGLGLPVILGIVKAYHGAVSVESRPGQGSTFRVYLPIPPKETRQAPETRITPEVESNGIVLLVEDESDVRKLTAAMLTHQGFTVLPAENGMKALEIFRQHKDDVRFVICDLTMPQMDGWETLAALRKLSPNLRVIMASGYNEEVVMQGEHAERPQTFLKKPFSIQELADRVKEVLK